MPCSGAVLQSVPGQLTAQPQRRFSDRLVRAEAMKSASSASATSRYPRGLVGGRDEAGAAPALLVFDVGVGARVTVTSRTSSWLRRSELGRRRASRSRRHSSSSPFGRCSTSSVALFVPLTVPSRQRAGPAEDDVAGCGRGSSSSR